MANKKIEITDGPNSLELANALMGPHSVTFRVIDRGSYNVPADFKCYVLSMCCCGPGEITTDVRSNFSLKAVDFKILNPKGRTDVEIEYDVTTKKGQMTF